MTYLSAPGIKNIRLIASRSVDVETIINAVCERYCVEKKLLKAKTRRREIVEVRQLLMCYLRYEKRMIFSVVGKIFGGRDHTTAIHACKTVDNLSATNKDFKKEKNELFEYLNNL